MSDDNDYSDYDDDDDDDDDGGGGDDDTLRSNDQHPGRLHATTRD